MGNSTINLIVSVTVFGLVLSVWCIGVFLWLGRYLMKIEGIRRRLGLTSEVDEDPETLRLWRDLQMQREPQKISVDKIGIKKRFKFWVDDAGWKVPFRVVVLIVCCLSFLAFIFAYTVFNGIWLGICGAFAVFFAFMQYTQRRTMQRINLFERQLLDAMGVAARSLRAGHPLVGAFQLIAEEIREPVGVIFRNIHHQQAFGSDLREALKNAAKETRNTEFKLFSTAVTVQMQSGGNLADLMDTLSSVIRARIWLNKRIRVLTAEVQFSKMILIAMPILLFFALNAIDPEYMKPLFTTSIGKLLMLIMFINLILGSWLMNKLAKVDV
jgi:tight adherence protein B